MALPKIIFKSASYSKAIKMKCLVCKKRLNWEKDDITDWEFSECCGKKYAMFPVKYQVKVMNV